MLFKNFALITLIVNIISAEQLLESRAKHNYNLTLLNSFQINFYLKYQKKDYANHPCNRDCEKTKPMECTYDFKIEWYSVLNRNCFNCTENPEDCFKPHCVSANGFVRPIKTVNRILPGNRLSS